MYMFASSANIKRQKTTTTKNLLGNIVNLPEITLDLILNKTVTDFSMSCSFLQSGSKAPERHLNSILTVYCSNSMHMLCKLSVCIHVQYTTKAHICNALDLPFPV